MASDVSESADFWDVLEEAEMTVDRWPLWQQRYRADIFGDEPAQWDVWEPFIFP